MNYAIALLCTALICLAQTGDGVALAASAIAVVGAAMFLAIDRVRGNVGGAV